MIVSVFGQQLKFHGSLPSWRGSVSDHHIEITFRNADGETPTWEGTLHAPQNGGRKVLFSVKRTGPAECAKAIEEHCIAIARFAHESGQRVDPSGGRE